MTTKCKMRTRDCNLRITTHLTSNVKMKRKRSRKPYSCQREKKPNSRKSLGAKMIRKSDINTSKLSRKTGWRTKLSISKNVWLPWRLKRRGSAECWTFRDSMKIGLAMKRWLDNRKKRKLCKWRSLKWSSSRSSRIPKLFRRRRTKSLRKLSRSPVPWCYRMLRKTWQAAKQTLETWHFSYLSNSASV